MSDQINGEATSDTLTYGDFTIGVANLPRTSLIALLQRGFAHAMGNEVSSRVSVLKARREADKSEGSLGPLNDAELASAKLDFAKEMFERIASGTLGVRAPSEGRASADPVMTIMRNLATSMVKAKLAANNMSMPKGEASLAFPDGSGGMIHLTRKDLIDRQVAKEEANLRKEAEKELAARKRAEAKLAGGAEQGGILDLLS
jgi:hypothetical protein